MKTENLTPKNQNDIISSIDDQLSAYKEMTFDEEPEQNEETPDQKPETSSSNDNSGLDLEDKSNPLLYYQSGKKKGQLRPSAKKQINKQESTIDVSVKDEKRTIKTDSVLTGMMLITIIDLIFPLVVTVMHNKFSKKVKIKVNDIKMSKTQQNQISDLADQVVQQLDIQANPVHMFFISLAGIYGLNVIEARNRQE